LFHQNQQIRVHSRCLLYAECKTNYHYPLDNTGKPRENQEKPVHDWSGHLMDAERYSVMGAFEAGDVTPDEFYIGGAVEGESDWVKNDFDEASIFGGIL
jgi:hypothetical protein